MTFVKALYCTSLLVVVRKKIFPHIFLLLVHDCQPLGQPLLYLSNLLTPPLENWIHPLE